MTTPDHLKPIEPAAAVEALCDRIAAELPRGAYGVVAYSAYGVAAELNAFRQTRAPHDGRRLVNALRFVLKRPDLATEVEALLPPVPRPLDLAGVLRMQPSGRWAVVIAGCDPMEITSGEVFRVEVEGREGLQRTRMEYAHPGGYYAVAGFPLRDGLGAALGGVTKIDAPRPACLVSRNAAGPPWKAAGWLRAVATLRSRQAPEAVRHLAPAAVLGDFGDR